LFSERTILKIFDPIKEQKTLSIIILAGFLVRVWGVWYGLPQFFVGDEHHLPGAALKMGAEKNLIASYGTLYEPPFLAYFYLILYGITFPFLMLCKGIFSLSELQGYLVLNPTFPWLVARLASAVMGTILIYLTYRITNFLGDRWVAYGAAIFVAFDPMMVQMSHFARIWVPGAFLAYLSLFFSVQANREGGWRNYILAAVFAAFSAGTTWITGTVILALGAAFILSEKSKRSGRLLALALLIFVSIVAVIILINPYNFLRYLGMHLCNQDYGSQVFNLQDINLKERIGWTSLFYQFQRWGRIISDYNLPILLAAVPGFLIFFLRDWRLALLIFCYPAFHFFYLATSGGFSRYMLPVMPALAMAASGLVAALPKLLPGRFARAKTGFLNPLMVLLFVSYSFLMVILWDYRISFSDTRALARSWIENNIPAGSRIVMSERNRVNYFYLWENPEAIGWVQRIDPGRMGVERKYLSRLSEKDYPSPAYYAIHLNEQGIGEKIGGDFAGFIDEQRFDYLAVAFWEEGRWVGSGALQNTPRELIKRFSPGEEIISDIMDDMRKLFPTLWNQKRPGPVVEIYRIKRQEG